MSERIGNAVYFSGWERGTSRLSGVKARLLLIMSRSSKPVVLSAGGLYDLSLESYSNLWRLVVRVAFLVEASKILRFVAASLRPEADHDGDLIKTSYTALTVLLRLQQD
ncbi:hypothetical protein EVAR_92435_1 [Eumeta japonica]|uniref:Uncharacterized protein n=1 Tax=Eumeta variegata TaxID=151549 RepID=A0A4C1T6X2_EUMVA|nr:hypothetical protein EVAR_92435_1 [Eumeta japonica]